MNFVYLKLSKVYEPHYGSCIYIYPHASSNYTHYKQIILSPDEFPLRDNMKLIKQRKIILNFTLLKCKVLVLTITVIIKWYTIRGFSIIGMRSLLKLKYNIFKVPVVHILLYSHLILNLLFFN